MQDNTPELIKNKEFNEKVNLWTIRTREKMGANIPYDPDDSTRRKEQKLLPSLENFYNFRFGTISKIKFKFSRHGVFIHYGVGRSYIREGNSVVRGSNSNEKVDIKTGFNRQPYDWFDKEIKNRLPELADLVQDAYGDRAMRLLLSQMDRATITKRL